MSEEQRDSEGTISAEAVETLVWLAKSKGVDRRRYTIVTRLRFLRDNDQFATLSDDLQARVREILDDEGR